MLLQKTRGEKSAKDAQLLSCVQMPQISGKGL